MCYTQGKPVKEFGMGDIKSLFCKQATNDKSVVKEDEESQTLKKVSQKGTHKGLKRKHARVKGETN